MSHPHDHWAYRVAFLAAEYCATIRRKLQQPFEEQSGSESSDAGPGRVAVELQTVQDKGETINEGLVDLIRWLEPTQQVSGRSGDWVHGLTKSQAQDLLDWLERQGSHGQVEIEANQHFAVLCAGFRVDRDAKGHLVICRRKEPKGS